MGFERAKIVLFQDLPLQVVVITREGAVIDERYVQWNGESLDVLGVPDEERHIPKNPKETSMSGQPSPYSEMHSIPVETQETIALWAANTFGEVGSNLRVAVRANEEMAELLRCLSVDDCSPHAAQEIADIVIVLSRLAERLGISIEEEVNRKMAINRSRVWKLDGSGHGHHVREQRGRQVEVTTFADKSPRFFLDRRGGYAGEQQE